MPPTDVNAVPDEKRMTLGEHLEELRQRVLRSVIALAAAVTAGMILQDQILTFLTWPHQVAMWSLPVGKREKLQALGYPETFMVAFKASFVAALVVASPYILYQLWKFVSAGLYARERRFVAIYAPASFVLFYAGAAFGYYILIPLTLRALAEFTLAQDMVALRPNLEDYVNLVFILTMILGAVFELPLAMLFTTKIGLISARAYAKQWRLAIVVLVVIAAVITPTGDVFTLTLVSAPMLILYELGVLLCWLSERKAKGGS